MKKRSIIVTCIVIIAIILIVVVIGANKFQSKINGKKVVVQGEDMSDIKDGESIILAVPNEIPNSDEDDLARKRAYEQNMYSEDNIAKPSAEKYSAEEEAEMLEYEKSQAELKQMEQAIIEGMYKYYDKEYVDFVVERSENRMNKDDETIHKEQEEMVDMIVTTLEKGDIKEESSNAIKYFLESVDFNFIENESLKTRIRNLGFEI